MVLDQSGDERQPTEDASPDPAQVSPETYDVWRRTRLGSITEARELDLIFKLAGPLEGHRLLDAGCGDGIYLVEAARRKALVSGVDISEEMLAAAGRGAGDADVNVDLHLGDIRSFPFPDNSFDVVIAVTVLCFVPDPQPVIDELARVLAPGGRLVIGELGRWNSWAAWRRFRGWMGSPTWRNTTFRSAPQLTRLVRQAGLHPEQIRGAVYYPPAAIAARMLAPLECSLRPVTTLGAAFIAISAVKPAI